MISANGGLPAHRYTPQVTQRWPRGSEPALVEKVCHGTIETCETNFHEQINHLTHLISTLSDSSSQVASTIPSHFCDSQ